MNVLVDTSVWSLALRRSQPAGPAVDGLRDLIKDGRAVMIGPIRQEILLGVRHRTQFERLREHLEPFVDLEVRGEDYVRAAGFFNECRAGGVQGSNTDFLICAVAHHHGVPIYTTDGDFARFADLLPISLHSQKD